jgi:hypothetical protein
MKRSTFFETRSRMRGERAAQEVHDAFSRHDRPDSRFRFVITPRP